MTRPLQKAPRTSLIPALFLVCGLGLLGSDTRADVEKEALSELRVFNRVVLLVKEQYVEPNRIRPKEMLRASLDAVEKSVPEVLVEDVDDDTIKVSVGNGSGTEQRVFDIHDVTSLWELSFRLSSIFRFLETRISAEVDKKDVEYAAVNGMLSKLDPHSVLLEPRFSQEMKLSTKGEFGGLGIVISIRDGGLTVISPIDGTPADQVGIKAQDKIVKIGEESTVNMGLDEAVERLRGKPATTITIWVLRKGWEEPRRFDIVRAIIKVDAVTVERTGDFAYVKIKQFAGHVAEDVVAGVEKAEKASKAPLKGMILDMRNNPGGLLDQAIEVSNLFLKDGVLVVTQEGQAKDGRREVMARAKNQRIDLPVVVLVNGGSASASEIVAGALKNRGRGFIVGDQTFGKGSVQQLYDFPDSSSLKLTIGQYLTPGDESIQSVGITPDLLLHPILAADKENLNLLPDEHTREEDLDRHLDDLARTKTNKAFYELAYLAESVDKDEAERRDASSKLTEDFEIKLAKRLLDQVPLSSSSSAIVGRDQMRVFAKPIVDEVSAEEDKRIDAALLKLGVDWTKGVPSTGKLGLTIIESKPVRAGETLQLTLEARNDGLAPLYRVRGNTTSTLGYLADREFLFGRIEPGQSKRFTVDVKMPKELQGRRDLVRVAVADDAHALSSIDIPVTTEGLERPRFSYGLFIDDAKGIGTDGNGDGLLQLGESVALVVGIKNTGKGESVEPTALLKNLGGAEVFIDLGRQKLEALPPGGAGTARFLFKVQQPPASQGFEGPPPSKIDLRLQVFDGVLGDYLVEKLSFPIKATKGAPVVAAKKKGAVPLVVEANAPLSILAAADASSMVLAHAETGARFDALAEINGFVRVRLNGVEKASGNLYGYVAQSGVSPAKGKASTSVTGEPQGLSLVYGRDPPTITFLDSSGAAQGEYVVTSSDKFDIKAHIVDDGKVNDAYVFVADQKVYYQRFGAAARGPTDVTLSHSVPLKPGVNVITVVAREDDEFAQREVVTVFSTSGDPLAAKKSIGGH
ncbi:MAG: MXAN_5808 family serine peptidase [Deltaproteobacteria bacterium]|nr:MXAN_5808 family serine peptidase [Deltaproteobacteria bacterium]